MRLLLDTHTLIWWLAGGEELSREALAAISSPESDVHVSAASVWEMAIKRSRGRLKTSADLTRTITEQGFRELPITLRHAESAGSLPMHHSDPFDRVLIAQAKEEGLTVATRDGAFAAYDVPVFAV
jgi:PIN domain nuclease of toxin-antitoxin system